MMKHHLYFYYMETKRNCQRFHNQRYVENYNLSLCSLSSKILTFIKVQKTGASQVACTGFPLYLCHQFADFVRECDRIVNRQSFDQKRLRIQKRCVRFERFFICVIQCAQLCEYRMRCVDFKHTLCFDAFVSGRHCV